MSDAAHPLRVILLTHGGAEKVLERLCALDGVQVVGVFVETETERRHPPLEKLRRSLRYDGATETVAKLARKFFRRGDSANESARALADSRDRLTEIARAHGIPLHTVGNYHAAESVALLRAAAPDLGVSYGTNIIKEPVCASPRLGSINLHQGLAPYYRGGPPIFWELFNDEPELRLTAHFVAAQVDAGAIIRQETVPLEYDYATYNARFESFTTDFGARLRERSAALVADAVQLIAAGTARPSQQDASLGTRYRLPTKKQKDELRRRLRARYGRKRSGANAAGLRTRGAGPEER